MRYVYPCILHPEEGGGFYVVFPDVRGALTCGDDRTEALEMAEDALTIILYTHIERDEAVPMPGPVRDGQDFVALSPLVSAKMALYLAMREQDILQSDLAGRLGVKESEVVELLNLHLDSPTALINDALAAVGQTLVVEGRAA